MGNYVSDQLFLRIVQQIPKLQHFIMESAAIPMMQEPSGEHHLTSKNDYAEVPDNVIVPCLNCRHRKRRCDGRRSTCMQCQDSKLVCLYADQVVAKLSDDLVALRQAMDVLELEVAYIKRRLSVASSSNDDIFSNKHAWANNRRTESEFVRDTGFKIQETKSAPWTITLTKNGTWLEFSNFFQFYELLMFLSGSASTIHRAPTSRFPYIMRRSKNPFTFINGLFITVNTVIPRYHTKSFFISTEVEEALLNFIVWHPVYCGSSNVIIARFAIARHNPEPSISFKSLCYAIGALNAHHYLVHHATAASVLRLLPAGIDANKFGRELAASYFSKARSLLGDQLFGADTDEQCANMVSALFCMCMYCVHTKQPQFAATYSRLMHRVATHLDYHHALRDPTRTDFDAEEIMNAMTWDWIVACESSIATETKYSIQSMTRIVPHVQLYKLTTVATTNMPEERLQTINEILHWAKLRKIDPNNDPVPTRPTHKTLDQSVEVLARWADELPPSLHLTSLERPWRSCFSFLRAINIQFNYHMSLFELYESYLKMQPVRLEPGLKCRAERGYSDAAIMITRLMLTYLRYGGCTFFAHVWKRACGAHSRLAQSADKEIASRHRLYEERVWKVEDYVKRKSYMCFEMHTEEYDPNLMMQEARDDHNTVEFKTHELANVDFLDDYFEPKRIQGTSW